MALPYVGEIRMFGGSFAPDKWKFCDGSLLSISEYDTLYQLIKTTYGGDGSQTFALPDLRGRVPIHYGNGIVLGEADGFESATLYVGELPTHIHAAGCKSGNGNSATPVGGVPATNATALAYSSGAPQQNMNAGTISSVGGNQSHDNLQPFLCISFIISLFGIVPSET